MEVFKISVSPCPALNFKENERHGAELVVELRVWGKRKPIKHC